LSFVQHLIATFRQAGAGPIVLVTGHLRAQLEEHVADMDVICLHNPAYATTHMLDSARIGLVYLQSRCERVLLTPVDVPLFTVETVEKLMRCDALPAAPVYQMRKGHPLILPGEAIPFIESYEGPGGLAGALQAYGSPIHPVEVEDSGILYDADTPEEYQKLLDIAKTGFAHDPNGAKP